MFEPKIKIRRALYERLETFAGKLGCSIDEFAEKALEKELGRLEGEMSPPAPSNEEVDDIVGKLKGLGYIR